MKRLGARLTGVVMALALLPAIVVAQQVPNGGYLPNGTAVDTHPFAVWGLDGTTPCFVGGADTSCVVPVNIAGASSSGGLAVNLTKIGGSSFSLGQTTGANSIPVVLASDQGLTFSSLPAGTNTIGSIVGTVAAGSADDGSAPEKIGAVYNSSRPTYTTGQRSQLQSDAAGNLTVVLTLSGASNAIAAMATNADAVGSSATGSRLQVGSLNFGYNGTSFDRLYTSQGVAAEGTTVTGILATEQAGSSSSNITSATTTTAKSGHGILHRIVVNTPIASETITVYDNTAGSGTKLATLTLPSTITSFGPLSINYDLGFNTGLTLVTSSTADITVVWR